MPTVLNDTFYPILLMGLEEPFTDKELEAHFVKLASIASEGLRKGLRHVVIVVNDPTKVGAAGRRRVANAVLQHMTPEEVEVTLASYMPVDNALVRCMLTAFQWFSPNTLKTLRVVSSMQAAMDQALEALTNHGTPFKGDVHGLRRALQLKGWTNPPVQPAQ